MRMYDGNDEEGSGPRESVPLYSYIDRSLTLWAESGTGISVAKGGSAAMER
jgi:hypothetical protein